MNPDHHLLVADLYHELGDLADDYVDSLISNGKLKKGQDLFALEIDTVQHMLANVDRCRRKASWHNTEKWMKAKVRADKERAFAESERKARASILRDVPFRFRSLTAAKSPRPRQFQFVESYWDSDENDAREDAGTSRCGLFLQGESGTGKSSAAYALWLRVALDQWDTPGQFVRSVEFVRLAKSKHLSRETKDKFDSLFAAMRDTDGILVVDDVGTENFKGTGAEDCIYDLIDSRTSWERRTVITCNYSPIELSEMFSPKNQTKMLRRFEGFFQLVNFDRA